MESKAIEFIKKKYCADHNDKQGFINGNFWIGIADFMTDFSDHENSKLIDSNLKLREALEHISRHTPAIPSMEWLSEFIDQTLKEIGV
jgi:hypothetical protein